MKNNKNSKVMDQVIYMDPMSYERYLMDIENLKNELREQELSKKDVFRKSNIESWNNAEFNVVSDYTDRLNTEIKRRELLLNSIVIVDKKNDADVVGFGDVLVLYICDQYGEDEFVAKLVGDAQNVNTEDYIEISMNAFVGSLIYGKKIGEVIPYVRDGYNCYIKVLRKLNMEFENTKGHVKELKK